MTANFGLLRTRSYYSFLESLISPVAAAELASKQGVTALALTDHNYLSGAIEFYEACLNVGIKPIIGLEVDLSYYQFVGRFTLLAKDLFGWANLSHLSSIAMADKFPINLDLIDVHRNELMALTGGWQSILHEIIQNAPVGEGWSERFITDIKEIFKDNAFVEVQRYDSGPLKNESSLVHLSKQFNLKLVAGQIITYAQSNQKSLFKTITAIKNNTSRDHLNKQDLPPGGCHFPSLLDFKHRFRDLPEAIANLGLIIDNCQLDLPIGKTHYPVYQTPPGISQSKYLRSRAYEGAQRIYGNLTPQIVERLEFELKVIIEMGYEPIFLIMEDILNHARELAIPTSSRGSAASSLVAHCLNITSPDPIALNLYFERFLNPARKKPPDIDTDIASHRRDEIIQYVFEKYHPDKVAMVGTVNRYRPKSAFSDVAKAYGLSAEVTRQLSKKLPSSFRFQGISEQSDPFGAIKNQTVHPNLTQIVEDAHALLDVPKHLSVHPGGIVIAPFPIRNMVPLVHSTTLGVNHAQYDLEGIEKFGMVKLDLLGIRGLTVLGKVADQIQLWHQKDYKNGLDVLNKLPLDDEETAKIIQNGHTIGCFQIESPGMRGLLKEIQAKSFDDIMVGLALYRPGPLRGGLRDAFVRRFRGEEPISHIHDSLVNILDETLGVILYQEQVLMIANQLGGLSISQGDTLRRVMSHPGSGEVLRPLRDHFIQGALQRSNIPIDIAEKIWEMMAAFAGYGYPKAHAASYALLAWQSAWCKAHYPAEFMSAILSYGGGYYSQRVYLMETRRMGLSIKPPDINLSNTQFSVLYPNGNPVLYAGLNQVRDLTQKTTQKIINSRPFNSVDEFLTKVNPHPKEARNLIMCGALEGLSKIPAALQLVEFKRTPGQLNLFNNIIDEEDWDHHQKRQASREILGLELGYSPLELFSDQIQSSAAISTIDAEDYIGQKVCVAGMRQTFRRFRNQANHIMGLLTIEDFEGSLTVLVSSELYRRNYTDLQQDGPFLIYGLIESSHGQVRVFAENIQLLK